MTDPLVTYKSSDTHECHFGVSSKRRKSVEDTGTQSTTQHGCGFIERVQNI